MSQRSTTLPTGLRPADPRDGRVVIDDDGTVQACLDALADDDCRAILDETADDALSAAEVSAACDLPTSTAYRKLALLTDAGLLDERTRVRRSGKHVTEYVRAVEDVVVPLDADGPELRTSRRNRS